MKKLLITAIAVLCLTSIYAQDIQYGATVGYLSTKETVKFNGISAANTETGFYIGGLANFIFSEKFQAQSELVYANIKDKNRIVLPIMAKYYVYEKLNAQLGPQFDFLLHSVGEEYTKLGIALGIGAGYDITENIFVETRYTFQLNDYYTGNVDITTKTNRFFIGVGYRF